MALPVVVPVGEKTADALREKLIPAIEALQVGISTDPDAHYGPVVTAAHKQRDRGLHPDGRRRGRRAGRRRPRLHAAGPREGLLHRPDPVRPREAEHADLPGGDLRPRAADRPRRRASRRRCACRPSTSTATASPSSPATATPRASSPRGSMSAWSASTCRSRCRSPITPSAAGSASGFGDTNQHGMEGVRFWTKVKTITQRWPDGGAGDGDERLRHPDDGLTGGADRAQPDRRRLFDRRRLGARAGGPRRSSDSCSSAARWACGRTSPRRTRSTNSSNAYGAISARSSPAPDMTVDNIVAADQLSARRRATREANAQARIRALGDRRIPTTAIVVANARCLRWLIELADHRRRLTPVRGIRLSEPARWSLGDRHARLRNCTMRWRSPSAAAAACRPGRVRPEHHDRQQCRGERATSRCCRPDESSAANVANGAVPRRRAAEQTAGNRDPRRIPRPLGHGRRRLHLDPRRRQGADDRSAAIRIRFYESVARPAQLTLVGDRRIDGNYSRDRRGADAGTC